MDPVTMAAAANAAGAAFKAVSQPTTATSGAGGFMGSADGYTVSTGGGSAQGGTVAKAGDPIGAAVNSLGGSGMYILIGVAVLALLMKRKG